MVPHVLLSFLTATEMAVAAMASSDSSHQWHEPNFIRVSRARIPVPTYDHNDDEDDLFPTRQCNGDRIWTRRSLDVRSTEYATGISSTAETIPPNKDASPSLQLHLETSSLESPNLSPFRSLQQQHFQPQQQQKQENLRHNNFKKTGTTIAGCITSCGHVILAADTRATQDSFVADKVAQKLHPLGRNAWCAGAGTSADLQALTRLGLYRFSLDALQGQTIGNSNCSMTTTTNNNTTTGIGGGITTLYPSLEEHQEDDKNPLLVGIVPLEQICTFFQDRLFKAQGKLGVNLILGCVDGNHGTPHLRAFHEHGSMDVDLPFAALGSGGLAAMSMLERGYHNQLTLPEAITLVQSAIVAGIQNDLGSGSQVDLCIIRPDGSSHMERCVVPSQVLQDLDIPCIDKDDENNPIPTNEPSMGINGFGNTPFAIHSQRVIMMTSNTKHERDQWKHRLGSSLDTDNN